MYSRTNGPQCIPHCNLVIPLSIDTAINTEREVKRMNGTARVAAKDQIFHHGEKPWLSQSDRVVAVGPGL
jgi:hypothetical protein